MVKIPLTVGIKDDTSAAVIYFQRVRDEAYARSIFIGPFCEPYLTKKFTSLGTKVQHRTQAHH